MPGLQFLPFLSYSGKSNKGGGGISPPNPDLLVLNSYIGS